MCPVARLLRSAGIPLRPYGQLTVVVERMRTSAGKGDELLSLTWITRDDFCQLAHSRDLEGVHSKLTQAQP